MLTQVTATMKRREVQNAGPAARTIPIPLLLFRRLLDTALHEAKRTRDGIPTFNAILERAWFEQHVEPGWLGWETSFANCCRMLGEDEEEARRGCLRQINRAWGKALTDWGRKKREEVLAEILELKAADNPAWLKRHAVQEELPLPDEAA